jgi:hypothetical protein
MGYPPMPFDWTSDNWGWTSTYFTTAKSTQYFPSYPNTYLWDWAEQVSVGKLNDTTLNMSGAQVPNTSLMSFMWLAESSYDEVVSYLDAPSSVPDLKADVLASWAASMQMNFPGVPSQQTGSLFEVFDWGQWKAGTETSMDRLTTWTAYKDAGAGYSDSTFFNVVPPLDQSEYPKITALLNTLISNKVRDGDLDQAKLQTLTAQLQNNTEAMTALIKAFTDMNAQLARAL